MKQLAMVGIFLALAGGTMTAQQPIDRASVEAALMAADKAWCQTVVDRDVKAFLATVAEDATFHGAVGAPLQGREAVGKGWAQFFTAGGPTITWTPVRATALGAGDVGFTTGRAERHMKNAAGEAVTVESEYVTVWRKQPDGNWQVIFDGGSAMPRK